MDAVQSAHAAAERIRRILETPFAVDELMLNVSAAMGLAIVGVDGDDASTLLRHADVAMYLAKSGHTPYELYASERDEYSPARLALAGELRHALETRELQVWYQPKTDMATGRITGAEALVRWLHPVRGLIMPDAFIPIVEQTNLLRPMTLYVLRGVHRPLRQLATAQDWSWTWRSTCPSATCSTCSCPADILRLLADAGLPASALTLEITESAMMADPTRAEIVPARAAAGRRSHLVDDFGTGHASLAYLKRLPVSELKIDRTFVMDLAHRRAGPLDRALDHRPGARPRPDHRGRRRRDAVGLGLARGARLRRGAGLPQGQGHADGAFEELVRRNIQEIGWPTRCASVTRLQTGSPHAARTPRSRPAGRARGAAPAGESPRLEGWEQASPPAANT